MNLYQSEGLCLLLLFVWLFCWVFLPPPKKPLKVFHKEYLLPCEVTMPSFKDKWGRLVSGGLNHLWDCRWICAPLWTLSGLQGTTCLTMVIWDSLRSHSRSSLCGITAILKKYSEGLFFFFIFHSLILNFYVLCWVQMSPGSMTSDFFPTYI